MKSYHLIRYRKTEQAPGLELLLAELSETQRMDIAVLNASFDIDKFHGNWFIFLENSNMAKQILSNPYQNILIDFDDFYEQSLGIDNVQIKAFAHKDYYEARNAVMLFRNIDILENEINDFLLVYHMDMFFYNFFRFIIYHDYENKGAKFSANIPEAYIKYKKLTSTILSQLTNYQLSDSGILTDDEFKSYGPFVSGFIEKGEIYKVRVEDYLFFKSEVKEKLLEHNENEEDLENWFFNLCAVHAFNLACERLEKNVNNKELFVHNFVFTDTTNAIIFNPTPYFFLMKDKVLIDLPTDKLFEEAVSEYFSKYGFTRSLDEKLKEQLKTKWIYTDDSTNDIYYYKRRNRETLDYSDFDEQDRANPVKALIVQGQINLTMAEEDFR